MSHYGPAQTIRRQYRCLTICRVRLSSSYSSTHLSQRVSLRLHATLQRRPHQTYSGVGTLRPQHGRGNVFRDDPRDVGLMRAHTLVIQPDQRINITPIKPSALM